MGSTKVRYVYAGDHIIAAYDATSGTLLHRYVYGFEADDPIAQVDAGGNVTYLNQDHIDSVISLTNASGNMVTKQAFSAFGESAPLTGTEFGFTGQRYDSDAELYHYKARYYSPVLGRFLQPDPIGYKDGLNIYAYVKNDPVNLKDPTGMYYEVETKKGKSDTTVVNIKLPLTFTGLSSAPWEKKDILRKINDQWTTKVGKYDVRMNAFEDSEGSATYKKNEIDLTMQGLDKKTTSYPGIKNNTVNKYDLMSDLNTTGKWGTGAVYVDNGRPHHEAGHILGIGHGDPVHYPSSNLMGHVGSDSNRQRTNWKISVAQIERIIKGSPYPGSYR